MPILQVFNVSKFFGAFKVLDDVSLSLEDHKLYLIIGPNGSGKSTLINVITGIYKPDNGRVVFTGNDITGLEPHRIYRLGIMRTFQTPQIFPNLTVIDNVIMGKYPIKSERLLKSLFRSLWVKEEEKLAEEAMEYLKRVKLNNLWDRKAKELSGGQLKLLEIARALMSKPKLLIMDEPLAGVNPQLAKELLETLKSLKEKMTLLIVEHRLDIIAEYADYVYAMALGKVISEGRPEEVLNNPNVVEYYLGEGFA